MSVGSLYIIFFTFTFSSLASAGASLFCSEVLQVSQRDTQATSTGPREKQVPRLFLPKPAPPVTAEVEKSSDKGLWDSRHVLEKAEEMRKILEEIPKYRWGRIQHIPFFARQLPHLLEILKQIPEARDSELYHSVDDRGQLLADFSTVGGAREHLIRQGQDALKSQHVGMAFFTEFAFEVLGLHYAISTNLNFQDVVEYQRYDASLRTPQRSHIFVRRERFASLHARLDAPRSPLVQYLLRMAEVKVKILSLINDGNVLWPIFAKLRSEDFEDLHLSVRPIPLSLPKGTAVNGSFADSFMIAASELTNRILPASMKSIQIEFSDFRKHFFHLMSKESPIQYEVMRKIWFKATHEGIGALYLEFVGLIGKRREPVFTTDSLNANVAGSVIDKAMGGKNDFSALANELHDPLFFQAEISPELRALSLQATDAEVKKAWKRFLEIYQEMVNFHFNKR